MIGYLEGKVISKDANNSVLIVVGGVGYSVKMDGDKVSVGSVISVFCHTVVREDDISIYAFLTQSEVAWFRFLIGVSGVGPTAAMGMISAIPLADISRAINEKRPEILTSAKGVGARVAEKCVVALSGKKLPDIGSATGDTGNSIISDAVALLCTLQVSGSRDDIMAAVKRVYDDDPTQPISVIVRASLGILKSDQPVR